MWVRWTSERMPIFQFGTRTHYPVTPKSIKPSSTVKCISTAACLDSGSHTGRMLRCPATTLKAVSKKKWVSGRRTDETQPTLAQRSRIPRRLRVRPSVQAENAHCNLAGGGHGTDCHPWRQAADHHSWRNRKRCGGYGE